VYIESSIDDDGVSNVQGNTCKFSYGGHPAGELPNGRGAWCGGTVGLVSAKVVCAGGSPCGSCFRVFAARALLNQPVGTGTSPTPGISETDFRLSTVSWLQYAAGQTNSAAGSGRTESEKSLTDVPFALDAKGSVLGQTDELKPSKSAAVPFWVPCGRNLPHCTSV
jgi:hypothetical protein